MHGFASLFLAFRDTIGNTERRFKKPDDITRARAIASAGGLTRGTERHE